MTSVPRLVDDAGAHVGHAHDEQVGEHQPEEELAGFQPERVAPVAITSPMTTGTELTDARAASSARRGEVGTTTVNSTTQTATQERPSMPRCVSSPTGSANSAAAMA